MSEGHEISEKIEHVAHENKGIALLIAVLALLLAFASALGKSAQTEGITSNVEVADLWGFYQAKAIRRTALITAAETLKATTPDNNPLAKEQIDAWNKTATRYASEPETKEGMKELAERAKEVEERRAKSLAKYHNFEIAAAAFEIGIVLASATIISGILALAWIAGGLGIVGLALMGITLVAPHAIHLF